MKPTTTQRQVDNLVYLDDYLDTIEALPLELQRNFTLMRELDGYAQDFMESVASESIAFIDKVKTMAAEERIKKLREIANLLSETLKRGEEKVALAKSTYDTVDRHCTRLDTDIQKFEDEQIGAGRTAFLISPSKAKEEVVDKKKGPEKSKDTRTEKRTTAMVADTTPLKKRKTKDVGSPPPSTRATTPKDKGTTASSSKTKGTTKSSEKDKAMVENSREKAKKTSALATDMPIDPNEPLYCYCQQVSYGEMVACDNEDCDIEWFHLGCTELKGVPKGKWYCRTCAPMVKEKSRQKK